MRTLLSEHGVGGNHEDWWYLHLDEATSSLRVVHEWHHMDHSMAVDDGSKSYTLSEIQATKPGIYSVAMDRLNRFFVG